jgi:hypothetical protein
MPASTARVGLTCVFDECPTNSFPPTNLTVIAGNSVTLFTAVTNSASAVSYQWYHDGLAIVGQTSSSLVLSAVDASYAGRYEVMATNAVCAQTMEVATIEVDQPAMLSITPDLESIFRINGWDDAPLVLESSSDLRTWTRLYTNTTASAGFEFKPLDLGSKPLLFFRVTPW